MPERILIVEDEPAIAEAVQYALTTEGFEVEAVDDGYAALAEARARPYDLLVLDLVLPGLSGVEVCRRLREESAVPILMLTAKDGEFDEAEALDTGADDFVTKPFSYVALVARLHALIRRGAAERPAVLEAGDLRFDPGERRVWRGEVEVRLTAREMALLEFLLRHRGDVVSKTDILDHVWDGSFDGDLNIVEVYVGHLRTKLDRPFGREGIQTVRGSGYRLAADGG
jgi:DNA-binding response OmpR family regulator